MSGYWHAIAPCLPELSIGQDEWVRRMMRWHFSKETGSLFWLSRRPQLGFDPITDVTCADDLLKFGEFDADALRRATIAELLPKGFMGRPHRVFETGGTTGAPIRIVDVMRGHADVAIYSAFLKARGHKSGGNILAMTPSGPHAYGWFVGRLADSWGGSAFFIDFDPRWVKLQNDDPVGADAYIDHLVLQAEQIIERNPVRFLFTTSKLLQRLCLHWAVPLNERGIEVVCTGGTSCSAEEEEVLRRYFLPNVDWIDTYGNTLLGHALQADSRYSDGSRSYHLPPPFGQLRVTDTKDWHKTVAVGERGRVAITTLLEDLFIPNMLERDSAIRVGPSYDFPWDGVRGVCPLWQTEPETALQGIEGVY
jgi:hypothetical protein